jgi:small subunit ribosomal protein S20e
VTNDFLERARNRNLKAYGPIRMPTKTLRITTRKTPCGEGSKTWSRYQLRIHKRVLDLKSTSEIVKDVTSVTIDPIVTVEITVDDAMRQKLKGQQELKEAAVEA